MHRLLAAALTMAILFAAGHAGAKMMLHTDLASLAFQSDAVVLARREAQRQTGPYTTITEHRVLHVYAGSLTPGESVDVEYGPYAMPAAHVSDDVVVFLVHRGNVWNMVGSGLRVFGDDGKVFRFEQMDNPGPYAAVPEGRDPFDVLGDPRGATQIDRDAFDADLAAAIQRARAAHATIDAPPSPERTARLLDLVGPAPAVDDDSPVAPERSSSFYADRVATAALDAIATAGDPALFAEGLSRARGGVSSFMLREPAPSARLLEVARSAGVPAYARAAAVRFVAERWSGPEADAAPTRPLLALATGDADRDVRAAALGARYGERGAVPAEVTAALGRAWSSEADAYARFVLAERMKDLGLAFGPRVGAFPVVYARRRRRTVDIGWFDPGTAWKAKHAEIVARNGADVRRIPLDAAAGWSTGDSAGIVGYLLDARPFGDGKWQLSIELALADAAETRSFALPLPPLDIGARAEAGSPSTPPSPPASAAPRIAVANVAPPGPRGCGCRTAPSGHPGGALAALLLLLARRRGSRRRRPCSPPPPAVTSAPSDIR